MAEGKRLVSPTVGFHGVYSHSTLNTLWHLGSRKWGRLCEPLSTNTGSHPGPPSISSACLIGTGSPGGGPGFLHLFLDHVRRLAR